MNPRIENQLAAEAKFMGGMGFAVQIEAAEGEPRPTDASAQGLRQFVEGWLTARGAEVGPPFVRISGRTVEIALAIPHLVIDETVDLFSSLERQGSKFRAGRLHPDGDWELVYPLPTEGDDTFTLLPEPVSIEERRDNGLREIERLRVRNDALLARWRRGEISEQDAKAQMASISETMEMLELENIKLRGQLCQGQS